MIKISVEMTIPNQLTLLRIILTPVFVYLLFNEKVLAAFIAFTIAGSTDWYDGYIARKFGYVTNWGRFLDPLADKILNFSAFISFYKLNVVPLWMVLTIIVRDFLITSLRSYAMYKENPIVTSWIAKWKTFAQMGFVYFFLIYINLGNLFPNSKTSASITRYIETNNLIYLSMLTVTILTLLTGFHYFYENWENTKRMFVEFYRVFIRRLFQV